MMLDRIFAFFDRTRPKEPPDKNCEDSESEKVRRQRIELDRREAEARRMNDALEGMVHTIQRKKPT
jgi:hypothetical protein